MILSTNQGLRWRSRVAASARAATRRWGIAIGLILAPMSAPAAVRYVNINSPSPSPPYTSWSTAATNIQQAVDAALSGDEIVVTNGVNQTGGRAVYGAISNRVAVTKPLTLRSVNGPEVTVILGYEVPGTIFG